MILRPALSTPRPLPRKRENVMKRATMALASANDTSTRSDSSGPTPAEAIQKDEAPLARRTPIQTNKALMDTTQGRLARLDALRSEVRALITEISRAADVELLDLMVDEIGAFARYKAAQDARTSASTAGTTLETGLTQLARAVSSAAEEALKNQGVPA
ncbi:hypothetical protein KTE49_11910 [Burkholderia multivorans]|uniref:hypothetical protein n=2 Tax=Burkholderia multivorans TaxID=87883 RepID=UPI000D0018B7|nr:hypothetical protein [Burkholderia multivorans]MBJ9616274.1 hypothetical protein [Burkholderia multivorans]MBN6729456.1 hypothetical protein [Burkholderia multivorans]MBN8164805.1 hypothetical protein [Burkholderia multivorans]MBN8167795.1 hypothetical protein [Burkholderia multivorans]MBN8175608.1 hypothetical protein [Burkholderia multivorans]